MGYSSDLAERVGLRAGYKCEVCGTSLKRKKVSDVAIHIAHSASTFHITNGPIEYLVTEPPAGMERFKGKTLPGSMFLVSIWNFSDDAFCVCPNCHRDIHRMALRETKRQFPHHKGRNAHWAILERVTLDKVFGKY